MSFRVVTNTSIQQNPTNSWPNRKTLINLDFITGFNCSDSWRDLTNEGKVEIPKNLYFRDQFNKKRPLHGTNINVGGFSSNAPLILRGDSITLSAGYKYFARKNDARETTNLSKIFKGYVTSVGSKIPIEFSMEDNMFLLKQTPVDTISFSKAQGLQAIGKYLIDKVNSVHGTSLTFRALTQTTFGTFTIGNETAAQVLSRLQKDYVIESYFREDELRMGSIIYVESEARTKTFTFQKDIIDGDDLEYQRKDDITLSAVARNVLEEGTGKLCKDGVTEKTKKTRLEVLVSLKNGKKSIFVIEKGKSVPPNIEGERRTLFFPGAKTIQELSDAAFNEIQKYYYDGIKGKMKVFGLPAMRQGDNVKIINPIMPEQDGTYKIKQVDYSFSINEGLKQVLHIDFKLPV